MPGFDIAKTQKDMIDLLIGYYPQYTRFVLLTTDMEFMGVGKPLYNFQNQIDELAIIKGNAAYANPIYPLYLQTLAEKK